MSIWNVGTLRNLIEISTRFSNTIHWLLKQMRIRSINKQNATTWFVCDLLLRKKKGKRTNKREKKKRENIRAANYKYFESYLSIRFVYLLRLRDTNRPFRSHVVVFCMAAVLCKYWHCRLLICHNSSVVYWVFFFFFLFCSFCGQFKNIVIVRTFCGVVPFTLAVSKIRFFFFFFSFAEVFYYYSSIELFLFYSIPDYDRVVHNLSSFVCFKLCAMCIDAYQIHTILFIYRFDCVVFWCPCRWGRF